MELKTIQIIPENLFLCDDDDETSTEVLNAISDAINAGQSSIQDRPLAEKKLLLFNNKGLE